MTTFSWRYEDADGKSVTPPSAPGTPFPSQADAESWLGEEWRTLLDEGVDGVRLYEEETEVYGPMSLRPAE